MRSIDRGVEGGNKVNTKQELLEKFDTRVNELRGDLGPEREGRQQEYDFGYKVQRRDELFTITDWVRIRSFLSLALDTMREETLEEVHNTLLEKNRGIGKEVLMVLDRLKTQSKEVKDEQFMRDRAAEAEDVL